jgi:hypothetical protein
MPRRRRKKKQSPEELEYVDAPEYESADEVSDGTEEQPAATSQSDEEEWPDWAYDDRPRRAGRSRRQRRRDRKKYRVEETPSEHDDESPTSFFDQSEASDEDAEPGVWVSDEPPAEEKPLWRGEEEEARLLEIPEEEAAEPGGEEDAPAVIVEPFEEVVRLEPEAELETDADPEHGARLELSDEDEDEAGFGVVPSPRHLDVDPENHFATEDSAHDEQEAGREEEEEGYEEGDDYEHEEYEREESGYQSVIGDVLPGHVGPRRAALHEKKRKQRQIVALVGIGVAVALIVISASLFGGGEDDEGDDRNDSQVVIANENDSVESMLLFGTREANEAAGATWLALLSIDRADNQGSVVYIPAHTAVEVPGRGLLPLGEAAGVDVPLLIVSTESLLGIEIDHYLELSDKDAQVLFGEIAPLEVDIPLEVQIPAGSGQTRLLFTEGTDTLEAEPLGQLLFVLGLEGDDVELGSRHLAFWDALFEGYGARTEELEQKMAEAGAVLGESDLSPEDSADFIGDLAALPEDSMVLNSLPVEQVSVGEGELYDVDEQEIQQFVGDTTGARSFAGDETRVQVLNGVGVPGIGDDVAGKLASDAFKVAYSGNARRFNYKKTLIIAYERSDEGIALAERAKELLGVGEVQISAQDQGIVDLTIVVGKDFLERT